MPIMFEMIKNIRRRRVLNELEATPREKRIDNILEVKTIGLICRLDTEQNWRILQHFTKVMEGDGKQVSIIALQEQNIDFVVTSQDTTICNRRDAFNFWGIPSKNSIQHFISQHYDLLIDTIGGQNFFSQYIALLTPAYLKVAYSTPSEGPTHIFDLIIRGNGQINLKDFINNIVQYLGMIKK